MPNCIHRIYWLNRDYDQRSRVAMQTEFARYNIVHIRVPAIDAYRDLAGNTTRAHTLSHLLAYERIHADRPKGQIVLVLEDIVSFELAKYWTTTLNKIINHAPADWGILQLAYRCDEHTISKVHRTMSIGEHISNDDPFYVEKRIILDNQAPYVPWVKWRPSLACAYLLHPRAYRTLLEYARTDRFNPDQLPWNALFPHTQTYTYNVPLFTTRTNALPYPIRIVHNQIQRRQRLIILVQSWYHRWLRHQEKQKHKSRTR